MARVHFTLNLRRHVDCPVSDAAGNTVKQVLDAVFAANPRARGYVLDETGALRKHMVVFVDGQGVVDRQTLGDAVDENSEIYVMQALSGG
jgi:sulfur carrier protein ThiS